MDQESINLVPAVDPAAVQRELAHSLERTDTLGQAIEEALDAAERELAEIRRVGPPRPLGGQLLGQ